MTLKILLPFKIFTLKSDVLRIVVDTPEGSFGILPHRLDCVAAIAPGILMFETKEEGEVYLAVDVGVITKVGQYVNVSVRNAIAGTELAQLHEAVEEEFLNLNEQEQSIGTVMKKMESRFIHRLKEFRDE